MSGVWPRCLCWVVPVVAPWRPCTEPRGTWANRDRSHRTSPRTGTETWRPWTQLHRQHTTTIYTTATLWLPPSPLPFYGPFPGPPGWAGARRELLDFMVQVKINRCRHTDHPAGRHSIRTNQCPPPPSPIFYRQDALSAAQPTVSKHWRQLTGKEIRKFTHNA